MTGNTILVVDDEQRMRKLVKDFLVKQDFKVLEAADGEEAIDIFLENKDIVLVILDVMMPKMDGWQTCREIRQYSKVPIIMLTARGEETDELRGFELGVQALLRRANAASEETMEYGGIVLNRSAHEVLIDGEKIDLSFKEFELLTYLMENKDIALSRERILNHVWDYDYFGDARTIDTHVKKLRSKLGKKGEYIQTIWGMGYKFEVKK